jgi:hypothetical protein
MVFPVPADWELRAENFIEWNELTISRAPQYLRHPITPVCEFLRFNKPLSSALLPFLQIFALNRFKIERGEPARKFSAIFTIYLVFSIVPLPAANAVYQKHSWFNDPPASALQSTVLAKKFKFCMC